MKKKYSKNIQKNNEKIFTEIPPEVFMKIFKKYSKEGLITKSITFDKGGRKLLFATYLAFYNIARKTKGVIFIGKQWEDGW